jgi:quercetin dioxygenase-like cupin family protein
MLVETDERIREAAGGSPGGPPFPPVVIPAPQRTGAARPRRRQLSRRSRWTPLLLMAAGLSIMTVAATALIPDGASVSGEAGAAPSPPVATPASAGVAIGGPSDVAAQLATYAPGQSSEWHTHTGLHAVVVLTGTLTVVDGDCARRTFGPGESYVGGREIHLAINETASPLEMAVTYMFPAGVSHTTFHQPAAAPLGCQAG